MYRRLVMLPICVAIFVGMLFLVPQSRAADVLDKSTAGVVCVEITKRIDLAVKTADEAAKKATDAAAEAEKAGTLEAANAAQKAWAEAESAAQVLLQLAGEAREKQCTDAAIRAEGAAGNAQTAASAASGAAAAI